MMSETEKAIQTALDVAAAYESGAILGDREECDATARALRYVAAAARKVPELIGALDWLRMTAQDVGRDGDTPVTIREHHASIFNANDLLARLSAPDAEIGTSQSPFVPGGYKHVEVWDAINAVVEASGGSSGNKSIARQAAVVRVENALRALSAPDAETKEVGR